MSLNSTSALHRQVVAVRRRLFFQTLIRALVWAWFAALALSAVWFLAEPLLLSAPPAWLRWAVLGASVVLATAGAVAFAVWRKASPVQAALALDEQFRLKERVTTSLLLRPDEAASPAGVALLADANQRVDPLRVGDRFPVRVPWTACLVPACAVVLALLPWLYHPDFGQAHTPTAPAASNNDMMKAELDKMKQQMLKAKEGRKEDAPKSPDLKRIEAEIDKMVSSPHETKEQVREDIKKGDEIFDDLKKQDEARAKQAEALKERLEEMERARKKEEQQKREEGPAKDLNKAVDQGDLAQAQREADELAKKLEADQEADELKKKLDQDKDKLSPKEKQDLEDELKKKQEEGLSKEDREKLEQQLKDLKDEADELTRKNEEEQKKNEEEQKKNEEEQKKDGTDKDKLQQEKQQLQQEKQQLQQQQQDLKNLSQNLGQAQQAMQEGKDGQAAQQMQQAGDQLGKLSDEGERKAIAQDMQQVQQMKKGLSQALAKQEAQDAKDAGKQGDQAGNQGGNQGNPGDQPGNGPNPQANPGQGSGARPEGQDKKTGEEEHQANSQTDDKGRLQVIDHVKGPTDRFTGPKKADEVADEIRRAAQEGAAASERERVTDRATADMTKGFFEKMRPPDKTGDNKPAPPK